MPQIFPFRAVQYAGLSDLSAVVAPPYDVLDTKGKNALLSKSPSNIVAIDLPHTPAKELGPPSAYSAAAERLHALLHDGVLERTGRSVMYAYRQTFTGATGASVQRSGLACTIELLPFGKRPKGGGILPHEQTFSGPKQDRMALMSATRAQLSPIFGLYADPSRQGSTLVSSICASRAPDRTARTDDGTFHELWIVDDEATIEKAQSALDNEDVFIADGHHRYTTALNYLAAREARESLPPDHPARRCLIVLVSMSDPGLVIWPTHRVLGGMASYSFDALLARNIVTTEFVSGGLRALADAVEKLSGMGPSRFGLFDFASGRGCVAIPARPDPLAERFPAKPRAWRDLTVAFVQHALVEDLCQPVFNAGKPIAWAFPHTISEVEQIGRGDETGAGGGSLFGSTGPQLAVIVRPTPLEAVREVSRAGELMPQKSTFFYPKLATGLFVHDVS